MGFNAISMAWMLNLFFLTAASSDIPPQSSECPSENWFFDRINNRCLLVVSSPMTYYSAAASCKVLGTQMAAISSCDDISLIHDVVNYSLNTTVAPTLWSKYHIVKADSSFFIADETDQVVPGSEINGDMENESNLCIRTTLDSPKVHRLRSDCQQKTHFLCEYRVPSAPDLITVTPTGMVVMVLSMVLMLVVVTLVFLELIVQWRERHTAVSTIDDDDEKNTPYKDNIVFQTEKSDLSYISKLELIPTPESNMLSTEKM